MKVKALIELLCNVDGDLPVVVADWSEGYHPAREVIPSEVVVASVRHSSDTSTEIVEETCLVFGW